MEYSRFGSRMGTVIVATTVALAMLTGCGGEPAAEPSSRAVETADTTGGRPGDLVQATPFATVDLRIAREGATATRIRYRSTSGVDDSPTVVSGTVFTPAGNPPEGGWPVLAYGHGTTGVLQDCAPSLYPDLIGNAVPVAALVKNGYLVVMPDYQGLGSPGVHPYLEPRTVGYNMIDAVRAAHRVTPEAGARWAAFGGSQGGQAAWAANELAAEYGAGLELVGAVSLAPAANMAGLATGAADGTLSKDQLPLLQFVVNSLHRTYPEVSLDDYLRGAVASHNDTLLQCAGPGLDERNRLAGTIVPADLVPASPRAEAELAGMLTRWSLPLAGGRATAAPQLVVVGSEDDMVLPAWTRDAVRAACARGSVIEWELRQGEGHGNLNPTTAFTWLEQRFAGIAPANSCARLDEK